MSLSFKQKERSEKKKKPTREREAFVCSLFLSFFFLLKNRLCIGEFYP